MKFCLILLCVLVQCHEEMVITREYIDYLKRHVDWEVEEYENNIFRGWTIEEVQSILGLDDLNTEMPGIPQVDETNVLPAAVSWVGSNCDHSVRNQGSCGACWAFATAGAMSDRCCLLSSDKGWLSPQELVSCDKRNYGCYGGSITSPMNYLKTNGLVQEDCFPYTGQNSNCPTRCNNGGSWTNAHVCKCSKAVNCYRTLGIKNCLLSGPVPIGFSVCQSFMSYKSGIYSCDCTRYIGGHATIAVGYSDSPQCNLYSKNSWGESWGNKGYFNMACETCNLSGGPVCTEVNE